MKTNLRPSLQRIVAALFLATAALASKNAAAQEIVNPNPVVATDASAHTPSRPPTSTISPVAGSLPGSTRAALPVGTPAGAAQKKPSPLWGPYYSSEPVPGIPTDPCSNAEKKRTPVSCGLREDDLGFPTATDRADKRRMANEKAIATCIVVGLLVTTAALLASSLSNFGPGGGFGGDSYGYRFP